MVKFISKVIVVISVVILLTTCSIIAPASPTKPSPQPSVDSVVLGNLFKNYDLITPNNDYYKYVVSIREENGNLLASGVLIAPKFILTAAHVSRHIEQKSETTFYIHYNNKGKSVRNKVDKIWSHPDFREDRVLGGIQNDLGIIKMRGPITYILPAVLNDSEYFLKFNRLHPITTIGFSFDKKKSSKPLVFRYYGTLENEPGNMKFLCNKSNVWFGDSGGAVIMKGRVIGIISSFLVIDNTVLENSAVRVDRYAEWITNTMLCGGD